MRKKDTPLIKLRKELNKFVQTFNLHESMVKDINKKSKRLISLQEQLEDAVKQLEKVEKLTAHNKLIYEGLQELKSLDSYTNGHRVPKAIDIYRKQVNIYQV